MVMKTNSWPNKVIINMMLRIKMASSPKPIYLETQTPKKIIILCPSKKKLLNLIIPWFHHNNLAI